VEIPDLVRRVAGALDADDWLGDLPRIVADLAATWNFRVGEPYTEGTEAFVARVTMHDGTPAVLKILVPRPRPAALHEAVVLRLDAGQGCARLVAFDEMRNALLLERLGPSMFSLGVPLDRRLRLLTDLAAAVARPAPDCGLPSGASMAERFTAEIIRLWDELDRPCHERTVEHALECAARRRTAHTADRAVLQHGDIHQWNALSSGDGFKLVDPDGALAEPEYDLGVLMREDPDELAVGDPRDRAILLARWTGLDAVAIWEWGVTQRVWNGLLGSRDGFEPYASRALALADRIATREC
jgi:streptomycin 6-kinase